MSRGYNIFEVNLARKWSDIAAGKEVILEVQSLDEGCTHTVRAIVDLQEKLHDGLSLRVLSDDGRVKDDKWAIKVLELLDPDEVKLEPPLPQGSPVPPYGKGVG
jgi:hypothetical protein